MLLLQLFAPVFKVLFIKINDIVKSIMKKDSSFLGYLLARFNISIGIKLYALLKTNTHSCIFLYCLFTNTYGKTCKCTLANIELPKVFV